jgi:muconolactone delta-isomerase
MIICVPEATDGRTMDLLAEMGTVVKEPGREELPFMPFSMAHTAMLSFAGMDVKAMIRGASQILHKLNSQDKNLSRAAAQLTAMRLIARQTGDSAEYMVFMGERYEDLARLLCFLGEVVCCEESAKPPIIPHVYPRDFLPSRNFMLTRHKALAIILRAIEPEEERGLKVPYLGKNAGDLGVLSDRYFSELHRRSLDTILQLLKDNSEQLHIEIKSPAFDEFGFGMLVAFWHTSCSLFEHVLKMEQTPPVRQEPGETGVSEDEFMSAGEFVDSCDMPVD